MPNLSQYSRTDRATENVIQALSAIFNQNTKNKLAVRLWNGQTISPESGVDLQFTLVLNHPGALRNMVFPPGELTLAESYLSGDFDIEGEITSAMEVGAAFEQIPFAAQLCAANQVRKLPKTTPPQVFHDGRQVAKLSGRVHSRERDRAAVTYHYDTGNAFYQLFLGKWMAYSCGYFKRPDYSLDQAQEAKFEHICRKLRLKAGDRLLDIGCGWGGFVVYAAKTYGVQALGITLSEPQVEYGQEWIRRAGLESSAAVEVRDYRDLASLKHFDKVVSIGMFEHVGRSNQPAYFRAAFGALRAGGLFLNHGIATHKQNPPGWIARTFLQRGQFIQRYVFPDGELIPISNALMIAEKEGFEVRDVESLREHYAITLKHWINNLEENYHRALQLKDERTYRTWRLYMAAAAFGFERSQINIYQALLAKSLKGRTELPLTRAEIYI